MRISTPRLDLREFEPNDWLDVFNYHSDPLYLRFYPQSGCTEVEARKFVQMFLDQQMESPRRRFQLAITLGGGGRLIGNCGIRRKPDNDWEADIGYELAPDVWGRGYATEAALAIVDFGFCELGLDRISSWCVADNVASAKVLEKLGLQQEGRLRQNEYFKERWWDTLLYGLLRDDWRRTEVSRKRHVSREN